MSCGNFGRATGLVAPDGFGTPDVVERLEYRYLVPDDPSIRFASDASRMAARAEVARAQREIGDLNVVRELDRGTRN